MGQLLQEMLPPILLVGRGELLWVFALPYLNPTFFFLGSHASEYKVSNWMRLLLSSQPPGMIKTHQNDYCFSLCQNPITCAEFLEYRNPENKINLERSMGAGMSPS